MRADAAATERQVRPSGAAGEGDADGFGEDQHADDTEQLRIALVGECGVEQAQQQQQADRRQGQGAGQAECHCAEDHQFQNLIVGKVGGGPLANPSQGPHADQMDREQHAGEEIGVEQGGGPGGEDETGPGDGDAAAIGAGLEQCLGHEGGRQ